MKTKVVSIAVAMSFSVSASVLAADAKLAEVPKTPEAMAADMWDFTQNPEYLKDPKKFVSWLSAALEPGFYSGLGMQMLDPAMWGLMANSVILESSVEHARVCVWRVVWQGRGVVALERVRIRRTPRGYNAARRRLPCNRACSGLTQRVSAIEGTNLNIHGTSRGNMSGQLRNQGSWP